MNRIFPFSILLIVLTVAVAYVVYGNKPAKEMESPAKNGSTVAMVESNLGPPNSEGSATSAPEIARGVFESGAAATAVTQSFSSVEEPQLIFRGRVVAKEDGSPLAGVELKFRGFSGGVQMLEKYGHPERENPATISTGPDGRFEIHYPVTPAFQMSLTIRKAGRVKLDQRWFPGLTKAKTFDFGDLIMQRGVRVLGEVRSNSGAIVPSFPLRLNGVQQDVKGFGVGTIYARSDESGQFEFDTAIPPGHWDLTGNTHGFLLESPKEIDVPARVEQLRLEVIVNATLAIVGLIVDDEGNGIANATVESIRHTSGYIESARTKEDGSFKMFCRREGAEAVKLKLSAAGYLPKETESDFPWGSTGLKLSLQPALSFELQVVGAASGLPIEDFTFQCSGGGFRSPNGNKHYPDGIAQVSGLIAGPAVLKVFPRNPLFDLVGPVAIEIVSEMDRVVVELPEMPSVNVRVVDFYGNPVANATVQILDRMPPDGMEELYFDPRRFGSRELTSTHPGIPVLRSQAYTDANGRTPVGFPVEAQEPVVRVQSEHPTLLQELKMLKSGEELLLTLPALGSIRGLLVAPSRHHGTIGLDLFNKGRGHMDSRRDSQLLKSDVILPEADGSFLVQDVKPGSYQARLAFAPSASEVAAGTSFWWLHPEVLQQFAVHSGEETFLQLDASTRPLASLNVSASLNGEIASGRKIAFRWRTKTRGGMLYSVANNQGKLLLEDIPEGTYVGFIHSGNGWVEASSQITVTAGEEISIALVGQHVEVILNLVDASGNNLPEGTRVDVEPLWEREFVVGADGTISLNPAPLVVQRVFAIIDNKIVQTGELSLAGVESGATITVVCE